MSVYSVATTGEYEGCSAEVGWERSLAGYWFYVTDATDRRVVSGGLDAYEEGDELKHLVTLYDLVEATNGIVNWHQEDVVLRRLRDDPWAEQVRLVPSRTPAARLLSQTFGSFAQSVLIERTDMAGPYAPGDSVVYLEHDPGGMRVWQATVTEVTQQDIDSWRVETTHGAEVVNREGEGAGIVPMDEQIAREIVHKGDGFLVESTVRDIEQDLEQSLDWQTLERSLGDDGQGRGR